MPRPPPLTKKQKEVLQELEPALRVASRRGDVESAKSITTEIVRLLNPTGHDTRILQAKIWFFEATMEAGQLEYAKAGLVGIRKKAARRTRLRLEATALLAICWLRSGDVDGAGPYISEVLEDDKSITSDRQRREFRQHVVRRFEEETLLASLAGEGDEKLDANEIHAQAAEAVNLPEPEILAMIGRELPPHSRAMLVKVEELARNALPAYEVKFLPLPKDLVKNDTLGRTFVGSLKRVLWRSLCDPESEVYKAWYTEGMSVFLSRRYYATVVATALADQGIALFGVAVGATTFLMRVGIEVFCEQYRPENLLRTAKEAKE